MTDPDPDLEKDKLQPQVHQPDRDLDRSDKKEIDRELDEELEDSMDASDPPSITQP